MLNNSDSLDIDLFEHQINNNFFQNVNFDDENDDDDDNVDDFNDDDENDDDLFFSNTFTHETHLMFECDECGISPITGPRYHCDSCENYDMCQICFDQESFHRDCSDIKMTVFRNLGSTAVTSDSFDSSILIDSNINDSNQKFICQICLGVPRNQFRRMPCCNVIMCYSCFSGAVSKTKTCPFDKQILDDTVLKNLLQFDFDHHNNLKGKKIRVKCPFSKHNCDFVGLFDDLEQHLSEDCKFQWCCFSSSGCTNIILKSEKNQQQQQQQQKHNISNIDNLDNIDNKQLVVQHCSDVSRHFLGLSKIITQQKDSIHKLNLEISLINSDFRQTLAHLKNQEQIIKKIKRDVRRNIFDYVDRAILSREPPKAWINRVENQIQRKQKQKHAIDIALEMSFFIQILLKMYNVYLIKTKTTNTQPNSITKINTITKPNSITKTNTITKPNSITKTNTITKPNSITKTKTNINTKTKTKTKTKFVLKPINL